MSTTEVGRKLANIDWWGRQALRLEFGIQEFPGFHESLKNRISVVTRFIPSSEESVKNEISDNIQKIGSQLGIEFIIAGRDYPLHSTLLEGLYEGQNFAARDDLFQNLVINPEFVKIKNRLLGKKVVYKYLLIDKGNILLTAINIPSFMKESREELADIYSRNGLKPLRLDHLLHITLARMVKLPNEDRQLVFAEYRQQMIELRHAISPNPTTLEIGNITSIFAFNLLHELKKD